MIRYIKGTFAMADVGSIVVETGSGIAFEINVPMGSGLYQNNIGDQIKVLTLMIVREDDMSLYGFEDKENLEMFKKLITVNGVGPKAAMAIMSGLSLLELKKAIATSDTKAISSANGIGKKTAERIILELKEKVDFEGGIDLAAPPVIFTDSRNEAVAALVSLGYSKNEAMSAVSSVTEDDLSSEEYIKRSLKNLF